MNLGASSIGRLPSRILNRIGQLQTIADGKASAELPHVIVDGMRRNTQTLRNFLVAQAVQQMGQDALLHRRQVRALWGAGGMLKT